MKGPSLVPPECHPRLFLGKGMHTFMLIPQTASEVKPTGDRTYAAVLRPE